jgi:Mor family transcriptional regulator
MFIQKTAVRNREIFAAHQQGDSIGVLAERHGLSEITVHQIIRGERYKIDVSVDAFYQEMRSQMPRPQPQAKP